MMNGDATPTPPVGGQEFEAHRAETLKLIGSQRTLVLATALAGETWVAPVYYVYHAPGFFFFSSPRSRHIEQAMVAESTVAATIFAESDQWEAIQGIQMSGIIKPVSKTSTKIKAGARFVLKFPFAEPFLLSSGGEPAKDAVPRLGDRVKLYVFHPDAVYYMNNRRGFGKRIRITL